MDDDARTRLATYGTLGPGRPNHHHLAPLGGRWLKGEVQGRLVAEGWGASMGFPGLVLDPSGPAVAIDLLESAELPRHWPRLDAFEGVGYERVETVVATAEGALRACIYVLARA
ncbi:gamma-glutamylcyclotransferase [Amaricoccus sp.]|uniref:gamma-glutamylcyclotransferase family protein n=1 Tax=Amaricoccus sp. TaxID=1872485 RepID=UPI0025C6986E|nr:gamma-glutamylcyclotransferase [Amaricoccus sp.]